MTTDFELIVDTMMSCWDDADAGSEYESEADRELCKAEARRLIGAAVVGTFLSWEHPYREPKELMTGFEQGYGCWVQTVDETLTAGLEKLPPEYDECTKGKIHGSFRMGLYFLAEIAGAERTRAEPTKT